MTRRVNRFANDCEPKKYEKVLFADLSVTVTARKRKERESVCVCVLVRERERERERDGESETYVVPATIENFAKPSLMHNCNNSCSFRDVTVVLACFDIECNFTLGRSKHQI